MRKILLALWLFSGTALAGGPCFWGDGMTCKSGSASYIFPNTDGSSGQVLSTDGLGSLAWITPDVAVGDAITSATAGSVFFAGTSGVLAQDNANFFWDDTNNRLGIGTSTPAEQLHLTGSLRLPATTTANGIVKVGTNRFLHSFGTNNTFLGVLAGNTTLSGADANTAMGAVALAGLTSGDNNVAVGNLSGTSITTGSSNFALGTQALQNLTTADDNVAIGSYAQQNNVSGSQNVSVGTNSMNLTTTGSRNTVLGYSALQNNTTGGENTALGFNALASNVANSYSTAVGRSTLLISTGEWNTAVGALALSGTSTGQHNVAVGVNAGNANSTGSDNVFLGTGANPASGALTNAIAIGADASVGASNSMVLGNGVNVGIGTSSPTSKLSVGAASEFQVNSTGNIVKLNNVTTSFPSAQGAANSVLKNNGSGTLSWAASPWTTSVKTANYTAVSGDELFANSSGGAFTITLPATPAAGQRVRVADYSGNWSTNNVTVGRNGENINGSATDFTLNVSNSWVEFVFVDSTQGWRTLNQ